MGKSRNIPQHQNAPQSVHDAASHCDLLLSQQFLRCARSVPSSVVALAMTHRAFSISVRAVATRLPSEDEQNNPSGRTLAWNVSNPLARLSTIVGTDGTGWIRKASSALNPAHKEHTSAVGFEDVAVHIVNLHRTTQLRVTADWWSTTETKPHWLWRRG